VAGICETPRLEAIGPERFDDIRSAIQRETTIKHGPRAWKVRLINGANPEWTDLYDTLI
jgi:putative endonuclease